MECTVGRCEERTRAEEDKRRAGRRSLLLNFFETVGLKETAEGEIAREAKNRIVAAAKGGDQLRDFLLGQQRIVHVD